MAAGAELWFKGQTVGSGFRRLFVIQRARVDWVVCSDWSLNFSFRVSFWTSRGFSSYVLAWSRMIAICLGLSTLPNLNTSELLGYHGPFCGEGLGFGGEGLGFGIPTIRLQPFSPPSVDRICVI